MNRLVLPLTATVWSLVYFALKLVEPPIPGSVMTLYMSIVSLALLVYLMADEERFRACYEPLFALLTEKRLFIPRLLVLIAIPLAMAWGTYEKLRPSFDPPFEGRTVHPEPPATFRFGDRPFDVLHTKNPLREDESRLEENLAGGQRLYYENCMYCHGGYLAGNGHMASAFHPLPANFRDGGTLSQLEESYVFWRIATGGPGLPQGAAPWNSAMPAFQESLTEEEIWQVILYIYEASGSAPRTWGD